MKKEEIFEKVVELLDSQLEIERNMITLDTSLIETLVMDSIQLIEFILQIENEFNFIFNPDEMCTPIFEKIDFLVDYIYENICKKES